ncbi:MAG: mandelate racemase/muconate lactonizing enzyme family protein [Haloferacaceae archaeon]
MIRLAPFSLALSAPLSTARGEIREREGTLVGVELDGHRGVGESTPLPEWTESRESCRAALESVADEDPEAAQAALDARADVPAARHGLALAVADARARAAGVSLAAHLGTVGGFGADPAARVPVNATVGDGSVPETAAAADRAVAAGFDCLKVKVGAGDLDRDAARLRAVRDAVGDGVALRADANGGWNRSTAARALDSLADVGLAYVEQPLPAADLAGHAALRRDHDVPVAVDESLRTAGVDAVLEADAADVLVLKPMVLGGPDRALDAARRARDAGAEAVVTTTVDAAVARTGAVHVAAAVPDVPPCGLATGELLAEDVDSDPVPVEGGTVAVPEGPGLAGALFDRLCFEE